MRHEETEHDRICKARLTEEFGWEITGPSYVEVPNPSERYAYMADTHADIAEYLIQGYFIRDSFDRNHKDRRAFLRGLLIRDKDLACWISEHSKLRADRIIATRSTASYACRQAHYAHSNIPQFHRELYDEQSYNEKVSWVKGFDNALYTLLEHLAR